MYIYFLKDLLFFALLLNKASSCDLKARKVICGKARLSCSPVLGQCVCDLFNPWKWSQRCKQAARRMRAAIHAWQRCLFVKKSSINKSWAGRDR